LTIGDCRLAIGGLTIGDWRSTGCRLAIVIPSIGNPQIVIPSIGNPQIDNPSIGNRQPTIGN